MSNSRLRKNQPTKLTDELCLYSGVCENRTCRDRQRSLEEDRKKRMVDLQNYSKELAKKDSAVRELQQRLKTVMSELDQNKKKYMSLHESNQVLVKQNQQIQQIKDDAEIRIEELSRDLEEKSLAIKDMLDSHSEFRRQASQWRKEACELQAAFGEFSNAELGDENPHNSTSFEAEVTELKHILSQVCMMELATSINDRAANSHLGYNFYSKPRSTDRRASLSCLLQKHIIQLILKLWDDSLEKYTQRGMDDMRDDFDFVHLENSVAKTWASAPIKKFFTYVKSTPQPLRISETMSFQHEYDDIMSTTANAMQYLDGLEKALNEVEKKEDAQMLVIKLRQLLLPCLCSKVCAAQNPAIQNIIMSVLKRLREFRTIREPKYVSDEENLVRQLVPKCIKLLGIQFKIYYPRASLKWYEHREVLEVDARTWIDVDGCDDGSAVDICMFPLVYAGDYNDPERVYAKAKVTVI
ncbi:443_t:CDS:2 [Paraglomus occultum]|uniref:443_t:CDS:1 n=1 Tax=Paraglomus occultum TaxID=144539 RepID=A0A9N8YWV7_9GLOM|nr:443_t:CDS:2 [Paraglomus occultum]